MKNPLREVLFFRWSFIRIVLGMRRFMREWQAGDGREAALGRYVVEHARAGDPADVIRVIDRFGYDESFLMNVGDQKGEILDAAVRARAPRLILELGAYCGYSALRMATAAPDTRILSVEFSEANAEVARGIWKHAGVDDRVTAVVGTLGDGGKTCSRLRDEHGVSAGSVELVFVDHDKASYLADLKTILEEGWLAAGGVVVADNMKFPGAPDYLAYMRAEEGKRWRTVEHESVVEYQSLIKDLVLVSELLAAPS